MSLELKSEFTIGGNVVVHVAAFSGMNVYSPRDETDEEATLFFVKDGEVVQTLSVMADCCQNAGFISELTFKGE